MIDRAAITLLKPSLDALARRLVAVGIGADAVTLTGFALGMAGAVAIVAGAFGWALVLLAASRMADGLDGAVARQTTPTDRGAFLDVTLDFLFYASVPLAFALHEPGANALPAAVLLAAYIGTGASFLAFAVLAERRGLRSSAYPSKGFYYLGGLTEAGETLVAYAAMCLWPQHFGPIAWAYAALCGLTTLARLAAGWRLLR